MKNRNGLRFLYTIAVIGLLAAPSCATRRDPHIKEKPRIFGDTYVAKMEPAPVIVVDGEGEEQELVTPDTKLEGHFWNTTSNCTVQYNLRFVRSHDDLARFIGTDDEYQGEFIAPFEARTQVWTGGCPAALGLGDLGVGQEVQVLSQNKQYMVTYRYVREAAENPRFDQYQCERWEPINTLRLPPNGLASPRLRAPAGFTYYIPFTEWRANGTRRYNGTLVVPIDPGMSTHYRGKDVDWARVFNDCHAY